MSTFLVTPLMCCVFLCTNSRHTLKSFLCQAFYGETSHAMTTLLICCFFVCTNPNQSSILGRGGNLQWPRAKKIELSFKSCRAWWHGPAHRFEVWTRIAWGLYIWKQYARALPLEDCKLSDRPRIPSLFGACTYENTACQSFATKCSCHFKLSGWTRIPSLLGVCTYEKHTAC